MEISVSWSSPLKSTNVSKEHVSSIFMAEEQANQVSNQHKAEDMFLQNVS
jgi:hypothetical protein